MKTSKGFNNGGQIPAHGNEKKAIHLAEENRDLKKALKFVLSIFSEHELNIDMKLYPHQQEFLNQVRALVKEKPVKVKI